MDLLYNKNEKRFFLDQQNTFQFRPKLMECLNVTEKSTTKTDLHTHNCAEVIYVHDGHGTITIDGKEYNIKKGDVIILNPGKNHTNAKPISKEINIICLTLGKFQIHGLKRNCLLPDTFDIIYPSKKMETPISMYFSNILSELERKEKFYMENCHQCNNYAYNVLVSSYSANE